MAGKTKLYVVTQSNTLDYDVGDEVKLSEKQALHLINKVRLKDPEKKASPTKDPEKKAE